MGLRERWPGRGCSGLLCSGSGEELGEGEVIALVDGEVLFEVDAFELCDRWVQIRLALTLFGSLVLMRCYAADERSKIVLIYGLRGAECAIGGRTGPAARTCGAMVPWGSYRVL